MKSLTFVVVALVLSMAFRPPLYGAERAMDTQDPMTVIQSYLRATYARDFRRRLPALFRPKTAKCAT